MSAARVWSRWKNSSSLDCTSSKVQWTWASISPGMTVHPAASMTVAPARSDPASGPTAAIRSPSKSTAVSGSGGAPVPSITVPPVITMGVGSDI